MRLPLKVMENPQVGRTVFDANGITIAHGVYLEDANFIVAAVNSFGAMRAALEENDELLKQFGHGDDTCGCEQCELHKRIKTALSLAETEAKP